VLGPRKAFALAHTLAVYGLLQVRACALSASSATDALCVYRADRCKCHGIGCGLFVKSAASFSLGMVCKTEVETYPASLFEAGSPSFASPPFDSYQRCRCSQKATR